MAARMDISIRQALDRYLTGWGSLGDSRAPLRSWGLRSNRRTMMSWPQTGCSDPPVLARRATRGWVHKSWGKGRHCCLERGVAEGHGA